MSAKIATVEDIKRRLRGKAENLQEFLNNPVGKSLIAALEEEFYHGELMNADPHVTAYNLGRRDVVVYLRQLQRYGEISDAS